MLPDSKAYGISMTCRLVALGAQSGLAKEVSQSFVEAAQRVSALKVSSD